MYARWSGCSVSARIACEVVCRVVSLPATDSSTNQAEISACVSRSPSISAWTSAVIRSSLGCSSRWAAISEANCESVKIASPSAAIGSRPPRNSSSPTETIVSAAATMRSRSASGTPIMSEIVWSGSRLAISATKSPPPVGAASATISFAAWRMPSSIRATCRGVNADDTSPRSFVCRGASIAMNESVASSSSGATSPRTTPSADEKQCGSREIRLMSS